MMLKIFNNFCIISFLILLSISNLESKLTPKVNKFAWQASLEAIKFMPLSSADPFNGVIITDWYSVNSTTRYKLDIYILDGILSSRSVQVSVFKQIKDNNSWKDVMINSEIATLIENKILNQAKKLRSSYYE